MKVLYQVLWAILFVAIYIGVFLIAMKRSTKVSAECINLAKGRNNKDMREACISLFTNTAVVAALFMTIQFSFMGAMDSSATLLGMAVYFVLWCSLLSSSLAFTMSVHMVLALGLFDDDGAHSFFDDPLDLLQGIWVPVKINGFDLIGLVVVTSDLSLQWLSLWGLLWIIHNLDNVVGMAVFWALGNLCLMTFVEFSYRYFYKVVEKVVAERDAKLNSKTSSAVTNPTSSSNPNP